MDVKKFCESFTDKTVAIVGSSSSLLDNSYGKEIDQHDIVIRINRGIPYKGYEKQVGERIDILSWGMGGDQDNRERVFNAVKDDVYAFCYHWSDHSWVPKHIAEHPKHIFLPKQISFIPQVKVGKPLTTGSEAVNFVVTSTKFKKLSVYGIDYYNNTGYWFYKEDSSVEPTVVSKTEGTVHSLDREESYIRNLIKNKNVFWF